MPVLTQIQSKETDFWQIGLDALSKIGPWQSKDEILNEALAMFLNSLPDLRNQVAFDLYRQEKVTLSRAAEIAGMPRWDFQNLLREYGIEIIIPEHSRDEMDAMIASFFKDKPVYDNL